MALIHCDFFSEVLKISCSMYVILPQNINITSKVIQQKYPTLYLLHGNSDDHSTWLRRTSIERYVEPFNMAVVMPAVNRSYYTDMVHGNKYWAFISEELPRIARSFFPLSESREDNFAAGLSMGGYGAFKLALRCPETFSAAASLSGALDIETRDSYGDKERENESHNIFGPPELFSGSDNDLFKLADDFSKYEGNKPRLYQCCGTEDYLYEGNLRFRAHAEELGLDLTYEEGPGNHEWSFWDKWIQRVLEWFNNK